MIGFLKTSSVQSQHKFQIIFRHKKYDIKNNLRYFIVCSRITKGYYDLADFLHEYIIFMTESDWHNDT